MKTIGIYKITSPSGRIYVGQSVDILNRWKAYRSIYTKVKYQKRLYASFVKYGVEKHTFEVIEECNIDFLNTRERYWQEYYNVLCDNKGLNCRLTKTNDKSGKVSKETLKRMSKSTSGSKHRLWRCKSEDHPMWGRKQSEETKIKISISQLGRKRSEESKLKISGKNNPNFGVKMSENKKEKLRKKALERCRTKPHPRNKIVIDLLTGIYYENAKDCAKYNNIIYSTMKCKLNRNKNKDRFKYV